IYHFTFKFLGKKRKFVHHVHQKTMIQDWNVDQIYWTEQQTLIGLKKTISQHY
ncbi:hypothetical protein AVEN_257674-1, partial [Araneus ventricosus]